MPCSRMPKCRSPGIPPGLEVFALPDQRLGGWCQVGGATYQLRDPWCNRVQDPGRRVPGSKGSVFRREGRERGFPSGRQRTAQPPLQLARLVGEGAGVGLASPGPLRLPGIPPLPVLPPPCHRLVRKVEWLERRPAEALLGELDFLLAKGEPWASAVSCL